LRGTNKLGGANYDDFVGAKPPSPLRFAPMGIKKKSPKSLFIKLISNYITIIASNNLLCIFFVFNLMLNAYMLNCPPSYKRRKT